MLVKAELPVTGPGHEIGVVNSAVYARGGKIADVLIEEAGEWSKRSGHVVWIGLIEPSDDLLQRVQRQFNLHPLAIEDAAKAHQYPKLEQYGEGIFIVARTAQMVDGRIAFGETHLFVGRGYVVSVRHGASVSYAAVRQRCEACPTVLSQGEDYIVYAILDFIVDIMCRFLRESTPKSKPLRTRYWRPRLVSLTLSACTRFGETCCVCAMQRDRWWKCAIDWNTAT
jgi:magnesium transporter